MTIEKQFFRKLGGWLGAFACASLLAACGGGGGSPGANGGTGPGPGTATPTVTVSLVDASGKASNTLTAATPLTVRATVKSANGSAVSNALVTFATDPALAAISPASGTALTDTSGVATVQLLPATLSASGAGTVTAGTTVSGAAVSGSANFAIGATTVKLSAVTLSPASISAYGTTDVSVDVLANGSKMTEQVTVNFSSSCVTAGKATMAASAVTKNGTANVTFRDQGCANADTITASLAGVAGSSSAALAIARPAAASVQFSAAVPTDKAIVIKGQGGIGRTETATLTFRVFDNFNNPLPNQPVTFSVNSTDVTLNKTSDNTDAKGEVITTVNSGSKPTTFRVQATLTGTTLSTFSDSIAVTTGLPTQKGFSISLTKLNVEGWSFDSGTTTPASVVNVLLADEFGNPVTDGTPVAFQTNLGAVGSSSKGACNTVNGGCSVDFRSQNPRTAPGNTPPTLCNAASPDSTRTGVASICASTTNGTTSLFIRTSLFMSGSFAENVYLDGSATRLTGGTTDLGNVGATDSKVFALTITDVNTNPMPVGTTVAIANIFNGSAVGVAPATVPNVAPGSASGPQGSTHFITIGSTQPKPCTAAQTATFNVVITTPNGNVTSYPFKLQFTCP